MEMLDEVQGWRDRLGGVRGGKGLVGVGVC